MWATVAPQSESTLRAGKTIYRDEIEEIRRDPLSTKAQEARKKLLNLIVSDPELFKVLQKDMREKKNVTHAIASGVMISESLLEKVEDLHCVDEEMKRKVERPFYFLSPSSKPRVECNLDESVTALKSMLSNCGICSTSLPSPVKRDLTDKKSWSPRGRTSILESHTHGQSDCVNLDKEWLRDEVPRYTGSSTKPTRQSRLSGSSLESLNPMTLSFPLASEDKGSGNYLDKSIARKLTSNKLVPKKASSGLLRDESLRTLLNKAVTITSTDVGIRHGQANSAVIENDRDEMSPEISSDRSSSHRYSLLVRFPSQDDEDTLTLQDDSRDTIAVPEPVDQNIPIDRKHRWRRSTSTENQTATINDRIKRTQKKELQVLLTRGLSDSSICRTKPSRTSKLSVATRRNKKKAGADSLDNDRLQNAAGLVFRNFRGKP